MILSWSNFLSHHSLRLDLESNPSALQGLFQVRMGANTCFRDLADNKIVVCLTRSPVPTEVQATFMHHTVRTSIQQREPTA